jgi:hypothetical protein
VTWGLHILSVPLVKVDERIDKHNALAGLQFVVFVGDDERPIFETRIEEDRIGFVTEGIVLVGTYVYRRVIFIVPPAEEHAAEVFTAADSRLFLPIFRFTETSSELPATQVRAKKALAPIYATPELVAVLGWMLVPAVAHEVDVGLNEVCHVP